VDSILTLEQKVESFNDDCLYTYFNFKTNSDSLVLDSLTFSLTDIRSADKSLFFLSENEGVLHGDNFKEPYKKINLKTNPRLHIRYNFGKDSSFPENTTLKISFTLLRNKNILKRYSISIDLKKIARLEKVEPGVC
jgi:hypothetical protein